MVETEAIRDDKVLAGLETEWWQLWRRCSTTTPFQSPAWLLSWWEIFHPGCLCVIAARDNGRLVGLAPFYLEQGERERRLLPIGISASDYIDVLLDPDCPAAGPALSRHVENTTGDWSEWELPELPAWAVARTLPCPLNCQEAMEQGSACSGIDIPAGGSDLQSILPPHMRRKLRLALNRAARRGALSVLEADRSNVAGLISDLAQLHQRRQQQQGNAGVFSDPRIMAFHQTAAPRLLEAGLLRLRALLIGSQLAAVYYGFFHGSRSYAYLTGFDPDFSYESPSNILLAHAIESAIAEGASCIDFLRGTEAYKSHWGAAFCRNTRRVFQRRNLRHVAA